MVKKLLFISLISLLTNACSTDNRPDPEDRIIKPGGRNLFKAQADIRLDGKIMNGLMTGQPISGLEQSLPQLTYAKEGVNKYGIPISDSGTVGILKDDTLFMVWARANRPYIEEIVVLSPQVVVNQNLRVGMNAGEVLEKYPGVKLEVDLGTERAEFGCITEIPACVYFNSWAQARVASYDSISGAYTGIRVDSVEISSIRIDNN